MAASLTAAEIIFLRGLLREMGVDMTEPTVLYVDNQGAEALAKRRTARAASAAAILSAAI
eukprot:5857738-Prymnesium_polylepis.1